MAKFKSIYKPYGYCKESEVVSIGVYDTIEKAAESCYQYAKKQGSTYECDEHSDVIDALTNRMFYMVGYGPVEVSIVEVEA